MTLMQERPAALPESMIEPTPITEEAETETPQEEVLRPRRWTTAEYYALSDAGFFDDERVELLDGELWKLPAQKTPHFAAVERASEVLLPAFGANITVRKHGPMTLEDGTEPEPDVLVVPGRWQDYEDHHPTPPEVRLLVEVSDVTLWKDRKQKQNVYARAGIADYWIVNLVNRLLEVYRDPALIADSYSYKTVQVLLDGDSIAPLSAPNSLVAVADLFPPLTTEP